VDVSASVSGVCIGFLHMFVVCCVEVCFLADALDVCAWVAI
jgi:hypothetical protein